MMITRLTRLAIRAILRNKMRSSLTMLGIIIGVATVVAMIGIGEGASNAVQTQIASLGDNVVMIFTGHWSRGGVRGGSGSINSMDMDDVTALRTQAPLLTAVAPQIRTQGQVVAGNLNWPTSIMGTTPEYVPIRSVTLSSGRFFTQSEVNSGAKVCVLGPTVVENLFPGAEPVGATIRIKNLPFQVIGVLESKGQSPFGSDQDDAILAPITTVQRRLSGSTHVQMIFCSAVSRQDVPEATEQIQTILRARHRITDPEEDDFVVRAQTDLADTAESVTGVMTMMLGSIAAVSLLVGGIGIMNIMLVSVTERTREIGIRMAVGARSRDILSQFLVEAIVLSLIGGLLGILLGYGLCSAISKFAGWSTLVTWDTILLALGFASSVGIFFGFYPARKAAKLDPIQALHYE